MPVELLMRAYPYVCSNMSTGAVDSFDLKKGRRRASSVQIRQQEGGRIIG